MITNQSAYNPIERKEESGYQRNLTKTSFYPRNYSLKNLGEVPKSVKENCIKKTPNRATARVAPHHAARTCHQARSDRATWHARAGWHDAAVPTVWHPLRWLPSCSRFFWAPFWAYFKYTYKTSIKLKVKYEGPNLS